MDEQFAFGMVVGLIFMGVCWLLEKRAYQKILVHIGTHQGREKLADGQFYYIVPESEWLRVKQDAASAVLSQHMKDIRTFRGTQPGMQA